MIIVYLRHILPSDPANDPHWYKIEKICGHIAVSVSSTQGDIARVGDEIREDRARYVQSQHHVVTI